MESTLHRQLKTRFGPASGGREEVGLDGFRIDAVGADGALIEIQTGSLGPLRAKLSRLLMDHPVRVVKPVVVARRVVRRSSREGVELSARMSPKRGQLFDVFDDLVGMMSLFPHPNLMLVVAPVTIDEIRVPARRPPGYLVVDRHLRSLDVMVHLQSADDLWRLIPPGLPNPFTTIDLAHHLDRPNAFACRVAYCLRLAEAARVVGKIGNRIVYQRSPGASPLDGS